MVQAAWMQVNLPWGPGAEIRPWASIDPHCEFHSSYFPVNPENKNSNLEMKRLVVNRDYKSSAVLIID